MIASMPLSAKDCYVGQRVHWVMWLDIENEKKRIRGDDYAGCWAYTHGASPIMWSGVVSYLGTFRVELKKYGVVPYKKRIYSCEIHAVEAEFVDFSRYINRKSRPCHLGEAARVLGLLSDIKNGLHEAVYLHRKKEAFCGR